MKTLQFSILSILIMMGCYRVRAQMPDSNATTIDWLHYVYDEVDNSPLINTGILLDKGFMDSTYFNYTGSENDSFCNRRIWYDMYNSFSIAGVATLPDLDLVYQKAGEYIDQGVIPILGMNMDYNYIPAFALDSGLIDTLAGQVIFNTAGDNPFRQEKVFAFASALDVVYGESIKLIFPSELYFTNSANPILGMEIEAANDVWEPIGFDEEYIITDIDVPEAGEAPLKPIRVRVMYEGYTMVTAFKIYFIYRGKEPVGIYIGPYLFDAEIEESILTAEQPIIGPGPVKGYGAITFGKDGQGNKHTCFTKPLIIVEGLDFGTRENPTGCRNGKCGTLGWEDIVTGKNPEYPQLENGPHLVEALTDAGYDIIYLDFHDGATYIEDNAMVLVKLIQHLNEYKCTEEELVVCGVSMGGQIAKYALSYMEKHGINHCTRTYVSFDSPHKGANIPIGFQQFVKYAKDNSSSTEADWNYEGKLLRPAPKQLLIHHIEGPGNMAHPLRGQFLLKLNNVGNYPQLTRNVAMINGSPTMQSMGFSSNERLLTWKFGPPLLKFDVEIFAQCGQTLDAQFVGKKQRIAMGALPCTPIDYAPGGFRGDIKEFSGQQFLWGLPVGTAICHYENQCFIPSISALDVNTNDYFFDIKTFIQKDKPLSNLYPFAAYYAPKSNQRHVYLEYDHQNPTDPNESNIAWLIDELENKRGSLNSGLFSGTYNFGQTNFKYLPGLTITSGSTIQVNGNYATGTGAGNAPETGSDFILYKSGCNTIVTINTGGNFILGDDNGTNNNTGQVIFGQGTVIEIKDAGRLRIHNKSKLIIEVGAVLIFHPGAEILLDGPEAVLEIRGQLRILNTTFTFSHSNGFSGGFVRFDMAAPNAGIDASGTDCKIVLTGNSVPNLSVDKVLEIVNGTLNTPNPVTSPGNFLNEFNISNGQITMGSGAELEVSVPSNFNACHFTGLIRLNNTGLYLPNPNSVNISQCYFENLGIGLSMDLGATVTNLSLSTVSFRNNQIGLYTTQGGIDIFDCKFFNNTEAGWRLQEPSRKSTIYGSYFSYNTQYGIWLESSSQPHLFVEACDFGHNQTGIYSDEDARHTIKCSRFHNNSLFGIDLKKGHLNLSSLHLIDGNSGGNCAFFNNQTGINMFNSQLFLNEGNNTFASHDQWAVHGSLLDCPSCGYMTTSDQVYATNNYWDPIYHSQMWVSRGLHSTPASFTGAIYPIFTSECFTEGVGGFPEFTNEGMDPWYGKTDPSTGLGDELIENTNAKMPILIPNPANESVRIISSDVFTKGEQVKIIIFDNQGSKIKEEYTQGSDEINIGVLLLPPGIYTFTIQSKTHRSTKRLNIIR